jgi:hypothetical protein
VPQDLLRHRVFQGLSLDAGQRVAPAPRPSVTEGGGNPARKRILQ